MLKLLKVFLLHLISSSVILAIPVHYRHYSQHHFVFQDRCNVIRSKKLCPGLQTNCCCREKHTSNIDSVSTTSVGAGIVQRELITVCALVSELPAIWPSQTRQIVLLNLKMENLTSSSINKTHLPFITFFELSDDSSLTRIESYTFAGLHHLRQIYISEVKKLVYISESAFYDLPKLTAITLKGTGLKRIQGFRDLGSIFGNYITINLFENKYLEKVQEQAFAGLNRRVVKIAIKRNPVLSLVENYAFNRSFVEQLILSDNPILSDFSSNAFSGIYELSELAFNNTLIKSLPTEGLDNLKILHASNVPNMLRFPKLPRLRNAKLTYPYHCCALKDYGFGSVFDDEEKVEERKLVYCDTGEELPNLNDGEWLPDNDGSNDAFFSHSWNNSFSSDSFDSNETILVTMLNASQSDYFASGFFDNEMDFYPKFEQLDYKEIENGEERRENFHDDEETSAPNKIDTIVGSATETPEIIVAKVTPVCYIDADGHIRNLIHIPKKQCSPMADKFNPCEDLLGSNAIAIISWFVAWFAVLGNFFVVFALLLVAFDHGRTHQRHLTVSKFLILNLAFADFCMGIYILSLAVMDNKSKGNYYKYGVEWQTQGGCDVVGFLSIFASQLSVYTLSVISLERWYAIRYAIQLDKRMSLKCGQIVMSIGWLVSIILASLPLLGINSYRKTAICLPMDVENFSGKAYVALLLSLNIIAFLMVCGSYMWMYAIVKTTSSVGPRSFCEVFHLKSRRRRDDARSRSQKRDGCYGALDKQTTDTRIAKRMAVLVFTDFACFFPISFFSLFAMGGYPLLSMSTAKFLLVFCYPLNACTNPFLYSIMTKSFKKDVKFLFKSLKRLICSCNDNRQRAAINRRKKRQFETSDRQQSQRKTVHVCLEAEPEHLPADGSISAEQKSFTSNTKTTYLKLNTISLAGNSRSNSVSNKQPKNGQRRWSERLYSRVISSSVSSSSTSDDQNSDRNSLTLFLTRILRVFKRGTTATARQSQRLGSMQPSCETHFTAAMATSNAGDVKSELEAEQYELVPVRCDQSFADDLDAERTESLDQHDSLL